MFPLGGVTKLIVIMNPSKNWLKHKDLTVSGE
jgi:hypothetical protein